MPGRRVSESRILSFVKMRKCILNAFLLYEKMNTMEIQQCEQLYTTQGDELVNYVLPEAHRAAGGAATSIKYMRKFALNWPDYEIV